jgi:AraC-like DNA-binding protein
MPTPRASGIGLLPDSAFAGEIEAAPTRRWSASDLEALGVDPVTARRHFKKRFGVSFLEYSRAHRLAGAFAAIEEGAGALSAQLDAGFESSSAFREAFSRRFGRPPTHARSSMLLRSAWIDTPLGTMIALTDSSRVHVLEFSNRKHLALQLARYRNRLNAAFVPGETARRARSGASWISISRAVSSNSPSSRRRPAHPSRSRFGHGFVASRLAARSHTQGWRKRSAPPLRCVPLPMRTRRTAAPS